MERFIADLVGKFETGTISRRDFCEGVALAAIVYAAGGAEANAAPPNGLKMLGINHISYACPDYRKAGDFYSSVLGMEKLKDDGKSRVNLAFGPAPGKGGAFVVARNAPANAPAPPRAVVDHVCYTLSNWNDARVNAALKAVGQNPTGRAGSVNVYDPFNVQVQLASAEAENPFI
jgi:catechol 2,3-dioxygenase-like lactoylglutathione lyase family enzyme